MEFEDVLLWLSRRLYRLLWLRAPPVCLAQQHLSAPPSFSFLATHNVIITHKPEPCTHFSRTCSTWFPAAFMSSLSTRHESIFFCVVLGDSFQLMLIFQGFFLSSIAFLFLSSFSVGDKVLLLGGVLFL